MFGANYGEGYNIIEEGFAGVGSLIAAEDDESLARNVFLITNLLVSLGGSYKVLKVPSKSFVYKGTYSGNGFTKYFSEGLTVGRLQLAYRFSGNGDEGWTLINIANNSNSWFIRFNNVTKAEGVAATGIKMNARIFGTQKWHRRSDPVDIIKILTKLTIHANKK